MRHKHGRIHALRVALGYFFMPKCARATISQAMALQTAITGGIAYGLASDAGDVSSQDQIKAHLRDVGINLGEVE